jgi:2-dehydro-3-deoxyphosphooctonate aldolase (KDO 8-P synthase)
VKLCGTEIGHDRPLFLIAGPCVVESEAIVMQCAQALARIRDKLGLLVILKASFDKANRTSGASFRGIGMDEGLGILYQAGALHALPIITDVHDIGQIERVAEVVDVIQTPAFLARQTDFIQAVAACGKPVNIKKGQFLAPVDMAHVVDKCGDGADRVMLCERGSSFGYHNLVVDMRGLAVMAETTGRPIVFDATHSVQQPGGLGNKSGGDRRMVPVLARAAVAAGVAGIFMETHPDPDRALSDGPNMIALADLPALMAKLVALDRIAKDI